MIRTSQTWPRHGRPAACLCIAAGATGRMRKPLEWSNSIDLRENGSSQDPWALAPCSLSGYFINVEFCREWGHREDVSQHSKNLKSCIITRSHCKGAHHFQKWHLSCPKRRPKVPGTMHAVQLEKALTESSMFQHAILSALGIDGGIGRGPRGLAPCQADNNILRKGQLEPIAMYLWRKLYKAPVSH